MIKLFASYNVHQTVGKDRKASPERIAKVLQEIRPDFVALQEISYLCREDRGMLEKFAKAIDAKIVEGITFVGKNGYYGNAVLSRIPIFSSRRHDLSVSKREPRGAIEIELKISGLEVQVIATHLGLRPAERRAQIEMLLPIIKHSQADVKILLGDFNEWYQWARPLRWLHKEFEALNSPATFPAYRPLLALDRIWVNPATLVKEISAYRSPLSRIASDHLPLLAHLQFQL